MKKIIASILAVFFVLLSPLSAYASTTESMMMYAAVEDDYSVMPLAIPSYTTLSMQAGVFNPNSDSYSFGNSVVLSDGSDYLYSAFSYTFPELRDFYPAVRFSFNGSSSYAPSIGEPFNSSFRFLLSNNGFYYANSDFSKSMTLLDVAQPFNAFATVTYSYSYQIYDEDKQTWYQRSGTQSENVPLSVSLSSPDTNSSNYIWDLSFSANEPKFDKGDQVRNVSGSIQSVSMTIVYPSFGSMYTGSPLSVGESGLIVASSYDTQLFYSNLDGSSGSSSSTGVSNAISSVSKQVIQVSTKLSSVQTSIESKISTLSTDIKTGLDNVVSSAQQNTQNIINTVTTKVDEVKTGITEVKDSILDLPNKIQEMLLGLIVPDSDTMADKYSEFSGLLEEKLGVIYQIPMMLFDFFDTIVNAATTPQTSLTLPAFQLPWIDGTTLTVWQPMEYRIIPEGMQVLSDLIKTITSMTVVVLTFNSVKRAYERFLRS